MIKMHQYLNDNLIEVFYATFSIIFVISQPQLIYSCTYWVSPALDWDSVESCLGKITRKIKRTTEALEHESDILPFYLLTLSQTTLVFTCLQNKSFGKIRIFVISFSSMLKILFVCTF